MVVVAAATSKGMWASEVTSDSVVFVPLFAERGDD